jgi:transposase InsO family protein
LVAEIRVIHARSRGAYGSPRVAGKLHKQGRRVNHKRVERLMAKHGIKGRCGRGRVRTTIRDPHGRPATDLVKQPEHTTARVGPEQVSTLRSSSSVTDGGAIAFAGGFYRGLAFDIETFVAKPSATSSETREIRRVMT